VKNYINLGFSKIPRFIFSKGKIHEIGLRFMDRVHGGGSRVKRCTKWLRVIDP
jgi:hypothetical protein